MAYVPLLLLLLQLLHAPARKCSVSTCNVHQAFNVGQCTLLALFSCGNRRPALYTRQHQDTLALNGAVINSQVLAKGAKHITLTHHDREQGHNCGRQSSILNAVSHVSVSQGMIFKDQLCLVFMDPKCQARLLRECKLLDPS